MEFERIKVDHQDEFIFTETCLLQMSRGEKFIPGFVAVTSSNLLIFSDYAPSEKVAELNVYHPVFDFPFCGIKEINISKLTGYKELDKFVGMTIYEANWNKATVLYFNTKKAKKFKKIVNHLKKVGKVKTKKKTLDCSVYN